MEKINFPRGERVWAGYYNGHGELLFIVTSKEARDMYFLYELTEGNFKKLGKAKEPPELIKKFRVEELMRR